MATKDTPKKYYKDLSVATNISRCRLCNCVTDPGHSKKLFRDSHKAILKNAEQIYGGVLPQQEGLPHLICRSCERKLHNATQLRNTIIETQQLLRKDIRTVQSGVLKFLPLLPNRLLKFMQLVHVDVVWILVSPP